MGTIPIQSAAQRCRMLELDHFMVPGQLDAEERAVAARRYLTLLLIQGDENHAGGTGKAIKVFNCFGEPICLKSLRPVMGYGGRTAERARVFEARSKAFALEYDCQATLSGIPGIPSMHGYGTYAGGPIMLMEWVDGSPLRTVLLPRAQRLPRGLSIRLLSALAAQVASVLCAARVRDPNFVHRDLSGMNVLVRTSQETLEQQIGSCIFDLRLIDFGSAMSTGVVTARETAGAETQRIWRNATPEYAPPEMLTHQDPELVALRGSEAIDVYELCGVLYELYCGHTPYRLTENKPASAYLHKMENLAPAPRPHRPTDSDFIELLMCGLQPAQVMRPSLEQFRTHMVEICGRHDAELADRLRSLHGQACAAAREPKRPDTTDLSPRGFRRQGIQEHPFARPAADLPTPGSSR